MFGLGPRKRRLFRVVELWHCCEAGAQHLYEVLRALSSILSLSCAGD